MPKEDKVSEIAEEEVQDGEDTPLEVEDSESEIEMDFSVVKNFDPVLQDVPYLCMITQMKTGTAKSGNQKVAVQVEVVETREGEEAFLGRIVTRDYSLQPNALFSFMGLLVSVGEDPEKLKESGKFKLKPEAYLGVQLVMYAQNSTYQGNERSQIRRTLSAYKWKEAKVQADTESTEGAESAAGEASF